MVDISVLPDRSRDALMRLVEAVRVALERPSPHLAVVGRGAIERGETAYTSPTFGGRLVVFPSGEPFQHHTDDVRRLFQEVIDHAPGLRIVIVHGRRASETDPWIVSHKLVAGVEVDALRKQRGAVDRRVKASLVTLQTDPKADVLFGRFHDSADVKVVHFDGAGRRSEPASSELHDCFAEAVRIYEDAGFELAHAIWSLHGRGSRGHGSKGWEVTESFV